MWPNYIAQSLEGGAFGESRGQTGESGWHMGGRERGPHGSRTWSVPLPDTPEVRIHDFLEGRPDRLL